MILYNFDFGTEDVLAWAEIVIWSASISALEALRTFNICAANGLRRATITRDGEVIVIKVDAFTRGGSAALERSEQLAPDRTS